HGRRAHPPPSGEARAGAEKPRVPLHGAGSRLPLQRMRNLRSALRGRMTRVALVVSVVTTAITYVWVVTLNGNTDARHEIIIGGLLALLVAFLIGYLNAEQVARRLNRIEAAARKIADGDFGSRIPVDSTGQLGRLARTFNEMQRRLAELDGARKQFIANASHEL